VPGSESIEQVTENVAVDNWPPIQKMGSCAGALWRWATHASLLCSHLGSRRFPQEMSNFEVPRFFSLSSSQYQRTFGIKCGRRESASKNTQYVR
jgi:hypothetical protein